MKKLTLLLAFLGIAIMSKAAVSATVTRVVGADLSLVPAYETAGDVWLDASGSRITDMIAYMKERGLTSVRVRLLVDPSQDNYVATCQDLTYVKQLGKRIKDAGMLFLLDIFYSDGFCDVSQQWIPNSWSMTKSTATATLANKVKTYTTESINTLVAYGAAPDYVQIGNEVSYGMLWDSASGASTTNAFYTSGTYNGYKTQITRFASLLTAAAQGVRASNASNAKIILHTERASSSSQTTSFYTWMQQAGFTDYDIIGLSYYPFWHGTLSTLQGTLSALTSSFPNKEIQIVETAYYNSSSAGSSSDTNMSGTWAYSFTGQAAFINDLTTTLNNYSNVTGLYYWQPEECGNGANSKGVSQVMDAWDNRGFWDCSWKSTTHTMSGSSTLTNLLKFNHTELSDIGGGGEETTVTTVIDDLFSNLDFESSVYDSKNGYFTSVPGWTINWDAGYSDGPWAFTIDQWNSSLCDGYGLKLWNAASNSIAAGEVISQTLDNLPAGTYSISAVVYTDYNGFQLFANDDVTSITKSSDWGTAYKVTVETTLTETGSLTIGIKNPSAISTKSEINLYCDNFSVTQTITNSGGGTTPTPERVDSVFQDLDFEDAEDFYCTETGYEENGPWQYASGYNSTLSINHTSSDYTSSLTSGDIISIYSEDLSSDTYPSWVFYQRVKGLEAGTYTVSAVVHSENGNGYIFANGEKAYGVASSAWGTASKVSATVTLAAGDSLSIGFGFDPTIATAINDYVDNFTITRVASGETGGESSYDMYDLGFQNPYHFKAYDSNGSLVNDSTYWEYGWDTYMGDYRVALDEWADNTLCEDSILIMYAADMTTTGRFLTQRVANLEAGLYEVTAVVHSGNGNVYLFANDDKASITASDDWSSVAKYTVTANVVDGELVFGLGISATSDSEVNVYCDNFTFTRKSDVTLPSETLTTYSSEIVYKEPDTSTANWVAFGTNGATIARNTTTKVSGSSYSTSLTNTNANNQRGGYLPFGSSELESGQTWRMESDFYLPYTASTSTSNIAQYYQLYGSTAGTPSSTAADANSLLTLYCDKATGTTSNTYVVKVGSTQVDAGLSLNNNTWYHLMVAGSSSSVDTIIVTAVSGGTSLLNYTTKTTTTAGSPAGLISYLPRKQKNGTDIVGYFDNETLTYITRKDSVVYRTDRDSLYEYEGIWYVYRADGTAYVKGYDSELLDTISAGGVNLLNSFEVDGTIYYPSYIAAWAMQDFPLGWITIPTSINCISEGAFYKSALNSVTIFSQYIDIWDYAFTGWDDTLENMGSKGSPFENVTFYAEDPDATMNISSNAFNADDIANAKLWVFEGQEASSKYTDLGFGGIKHIGVVFGDADGDGQTNVTDVNRMAQIVLGSYTPACLCASDMDGDGRVSIADVVALIKQLVGPKE